MPTANRARGDFEGLPLHPNGSISFDVISGLFQVKRKFYTRAGVWCGLMRPDCAYCVFVYCSTFRESSEARVLRTIRDNAVRVYRLKLALDVVDQRCAAKIEVAGVPEGLGSRAFQHRRWDGTGKRPR
jgi:hypothetical protein